MVDAPVSAVSPKEAYRFSLNITFPFGGIKWSYWLDLLCHSDFCTEQLRQFSGYFMTKKEEEKKFHGH